MRDDQLLQDIVELEGADEIIALFRQHGITTYRQLFAALRDERTNEKVRIEACFVLRFRHQPLIYSERRVDRRTAVPALLKAFKSPNDNIRMQAVKTLVQLSPKAAVQPLSQIMFDRTQPFQIRLQALWDLRDLWEPSATPPVRQLMLDPSEDPQLRGEAIEAITVISPDFHDFIALLSDPSADVRFWAAYALSQAHKDITSVLPEIDRAAAFDHSVPEYWGWHVDREAIYALEQIYCRLLDLGKIVVDDYYHILMRPYLISPAPEYDTYFHQYVTLPKIHPNTLAVPVITFRMEPDSLAQKLREKWPHVKLNIRQPRPQTYLLDWQVQIGEQPLIGGLHRDQYAIVITGEERAVNLFAAWYRSIVEPRQALYIYPWAEYAVRLFPGITAEGIRKAKPISGIWESLFPVDDSESE